MKLVFATNNKHKLGEISHMLNDTGIELLNLNDIGCVEEIPETADTLEGNALQKASFIYDKFQLNCFADDTGLEVEALNGAPGVYSARYAGEGCSFDDNINKLLSEMKDVVNRNASFKTVIALIIDGKTYYFTGEVKGKITTERHGTNGFGYDPIFIPDGYNITFAEMDANTKNRLSHRYFATDKLIQFLKKTNMRVLLLGSGGREHTFAWKISKSPLLKKLYIAPGNAGTQLHGENINLSPVDFEAIRQFVLSNRINLVLVGPEDPLVLGIYDFFLAHDDIKHIPVIGPRKEGAKLEGSKDFAKAFMKKHAIPTAAYQTFSADSIIKAYKFIDELKPPYVLKADGLAAGKGVVIVDNPEEAKAELKRMLIEKKFGEASSKVVIEEFLKGIELSVFVVTDGISYKILPEAKDYKRIGEGDTGPNTGGMGTVSGVPFATPEFMKKVEDKIIIPTIEGLKKDNIPYKGFIFIGLINVSEEPYVIEYNVRMGDPETESVLPRIKNDFLEILQAVATETLDNITIKIDSRFTATIMLVSDGYPGTYRKGDEITGLDADYCGSLIFHAGTALNANNNVVTNGGRVLGVTSFGDTLSEALAKSYDCIYNINFNGKKFRSDIGKDLVNLKP